MAATDNLSSTQFGTSDPLDPTPVASDRAEDSNYGWGGGISALGDDGGSDRPGAFKGDSSGLGASPWLSALHGGSGDAKETIAAKQRKVAANTGDTDYSRADLPTDRPKYDQRNATAEASLVTSGKDIWGRNAT